jgi:molybdopterin-guanine dinucleotide biosynthesis protein B
MRFNPTKLLAVVGSKKSGKTTVVESIISGLTSKGLLVGSIKHTHHPNFTIDREGTDTWRHAHAGSRMVALVGNSEIALIVKDSSQDRLAYVLDVMTKRGLDVIVVEGFHSYMGQRPEVFKVVTAHDREDLRERLRGTVPPILAVSGIIAEKESQLPDIPAPIINSRTDCQKLVERIEEVIRKDMPQ